MAYNTKNPVGSSDLRDVWDNADIFDQLINGDAIEVTGRLGIKLKGIAALQAIITSLDVSGFTFSDAATGIANTSSGQYFRVPQGADSDDAFIYYQNNNGSATEVAKLIGSSYVKSRIPDISSIKTKVPIVIDDEGNVLIWMDEGMLNTAKLHPDITSTMELNEVGGKTALIVDDAGNVLLWMENGLLSTSGLNPDLLSDYATKQDIGSIIDITKKFGNVSDGHTLWNAKSKISALQRGVSTKLKIGFTGDSWTEHKEIPQAFAKYLYEKLGKAGEGWIQLNIDADNLINGVKLNRTGFDVYDASATTVKPDFPTSMDGQYIYTSSSSGALTIDSLDSSALSIIFYDGAGSFEYSVNGSSPVTITLSGTNKIKKINLNGKFSGSNSVSVTTNTNTGTVVIYGFYAEGNGTGVEINKMGNGGITAPGYIKTLPYLPQTSGIVNPDIMFMIISTNDYRTSVPISDFKSSLKEWITAWKNECPNTGFVLVAPAQSNASGAAPLSEFRNAMSDVANDLGVEFFSMYDFMTTVWSDANAAGIWLNNLHLSDIGAQMLFNELNNKFLGV